MDKEMRSYIAGLKPQNLPDWRVLLEEGKELGRQNPTKRSRFLDWTGFDTYYDYRKDLIEKGKINWQILLGLATLDEELDAIHEAYEWAQRTGIPLDTVQCIPSQLICIPKELRDQAPAPTSYVINGLEDFEKHGEQSPLQIIFEDQCLSCPNSLETTLGPLRVGSPRIGIISQMIWDYPGCDDMVGRFSDIIRSLGIIASKKDEKICVDNYLDDGIPGFFLDHMSYVAYALLSHHIVTECCGALESVSYAGLLTEGKPRNAIAVAIHKLLTTDDWLKMSYINGSTTMQWDHDIDNNWGPIAQELLFETLVELHYKMGMAINPTSITEAIKVPTLQDLLNNIGVGYRMEEKASDWADLIDWTPIDEMSDVMAEQATKMYNNMIEGFQEAGIDTDNPLEMFLVLKTMNPMKFELAFHPTTYHDNSRQLEAFYPTILGRETLEKSTQIIEDLTAKGYKGKLKDIRIAIASGDGHTYGLNLVQNVLVALGADVVNGGLDHTAADLLDLADEEECEFVGVSVHNGQGLDVAKILTDLMKDRGKEYHVFMGGKLNGILPGQSEPEDVTDLIAQTKVFPSNDMETTIKMILETAGRTA